MHLWQASRAKATAIAARAVHAAVEGSVFPVTPTGFGCVLAVHAGTLAYLIGPGKTCGLAVQAVVLCSVGKFAYVLVTTLPKKIDADQQALDSIWQWNPPGELGESGAWQVVKELASIYHKTDDSMPGLAQLEPIPFHEIFVRLCYKFDDTLRDPEVDADVEGSSTDRITAEFLDELNLYLHFADVIYEAGTEPRLLEIIGEQGYALNFAKMEASWGQEHCPAFFVATNAAAKQLLVCIRGTREVEDILADITAFPVEFDGTGQMVHSGMLKSALWLCKRILPLAKVVARAGYRIVFAGHSLGAGAAVLMAMLFKRRGIDNVHVYAFASPPCMERDLALSCSDYVQSVAFRDDAVIRFSPQALVKLHGELLSYDWESAYEERGKDSRMLSMAAKMAKAVSVVSSSFSGGKRDSSNEAAAEADEDSNDQEGDGEGNDEKQKTYDPHVPGSVLFMHRGRRVLDATEEPALQMAMVDGTCPQLRSLRLTSFMLNDHLTASYFVGLGRDNPLEGWLARQSRSEGGSDGRERGKGDAEEHEAGSRGGGDMEGRS